MLSYKHNEYEYIYDENSNNNSIEIRKDGLIVDTVQSSVTDLKDAKNLKNAVQMLGLDN